MIYHKKRISAHILYFLLVFLPQMIYSDAFIPTDNSLHIHTMYVCERHHTMPAPCPIDTAIAHVNKSQPLAHPTYVAIENKPKQVIRLDEGVVKHTDNGLDVPYVVILSRGFAKSNWIGWNDNYLCIGGCLKAAYWPIRDNIIHVPCITFDYPETWSMLNFGQTTDVACMEYVYTRVKEVYPNSKIIIYADCRGARSASVFVAKKQPDDIAAMVLLSPISSLNEICEQTARSYVKYIPKAHRILKWFLARLRNYDTKQDNIYQELSLLPPTIPIFIGHRLNDTLISTRHMQTILDSIKKSGNTDVHFVVVDDNTEPHSKLTTNTIIQKEINLFFKKYGLPHVEL